MPGRFPGARRSLMPWDAPQPPRLSSPHSCDPRRRRIHSALLLNRRALTACPSRAEAIGPAISVRDLVVSYNGRRVLDGINLDIAQGETMVLLGGSGSGKSTLLRHIIGLERPQKGQVIVRGTNLAETNATRAEETPAFHRSRISERSVIQFDVRGRQHRAAAARAHRLQNPQFA